ncbi:FecCD family ABC transporter permease [Olivibacter sitiensis]|uniref:FecCD family ABC transporter permease n=1 Tax=Olivibacter sitiensis TaxID=376470 RepID=UPI00042598D5|nr:iron ABC transporter permease [Olivibacter sitiensis]
MDSNKLIVKVLLALLLLVLLAVSLAACVGALHIRFDELVSILAYQLHLSDHMGFSAQQQSVLVGIRLPRVVLGLLVGATLSMSGAAMQGLFRNPLAEPGLIGISSGASLFAVLTIVLQADYFPWLGQLFGYYALAIAAFIGACLTTFLVYGIAVKKGRTDVLTLLLVGLAINALAGSFTGLLTYVASDAQLRDITFWSLGSLGGASWKTVLAISPFVFISLVGIPFLAKPLNAFSLGEEQASHLGVSVQRTKRWTVLLATLGVGACVAVSGTIGFVALVVPHILRMAFTADYRLVIPASGLLGAAVLVLADLLARTIVAPSELPIGIITALVGTPIFMLIIIRERRQRI